MAAAINCNDFRSCISLTSFGLRETPVSFCPAKPYHGKLFGDSPLPIKLQPIRWPPIIMVVIKHTTPANLAQGGKSLLKIAVIEQSGGLEGALGKSISQGLFAPPNGASLK